MAAHQAPRPWDSPGKNNAVGCHFLLQCMKVKSKSDVAQSCLTVSEPIDCGPPGSSVHGIFQARVLEWGAIAFSISYHWLVLNQRSSNWWTPGPRGSRKAFLGESTQVWDTCSGHMFKTPFTPYSIHFPTVSLSSTQPTSFSIYYAVLWPLKRPIKILVLEKPTLLI